MTNRRYIFRLSDSISQLFNTVILNGDPDESISGRAYRRTMEGSRVWRKVMSVVDMIFFWQESHTANAYQSDLDRAEARIAAHGRMIGADRAS